MPPIAFLITASSSCSITWLGVHGGIERHFSYDEQLFNKHPVIQKWPILVPVTCTAFLISLFSLLASPALMPLPSIPCKIWSLPQPAVRTYMAFCYINWRTWAFSKHLCPFSCLALVLHKSQPLSTPTYSSRLDRGLWIFRLSKVYHCLLCPGHNELELVPSITLSKAVNHSSVQVSWLNWLAS